MYQRVQVMVPVLIFSHGDLYLVVSEAVKDEELNIETCQDMDSKAYSCCTARTTSVKVEIIMQTYHKVMPLHGDVREA